MPEKSPEELNAENAELLARVAALEDRANSAEGSNDELKAANAALASQNKTLSAGLGLAGTKSGLPREVLDDINRRRDQGLSDAHATEAALRQHRHNIDLAKKREEKRVEDAADKTPPAPPTPPNGGKTPPAQTVPPANGSKK